MPVIDLTHTIQPDIPVFPGTEPPRIEQANTIAEHGFAEPRLTMVPLHPPKGSSGQECLGYRPFISALTAR